MYYYCERHGVSNPGEQSIQQLVQTESNTNIKALY